MNCCEKSCMSFLREATRCFPLPTYWRASAEHLQLVSTNGITNRLVFFSTRHSFVKTCNCSSSILLAFQRDWIAARSAISFVSRTTRFILSSKGLPSSSIILTREQISLVNRVCTHCVWSWWHVSTLLPQYSFPAWNSAMALATSGPAIIQYHWPLGLSLGPTAPPSPLIWVLSCSCAWSIEIVENTFFVFSTVKLPSMNFLATSGFFLGSSAMSRKCTGIHLA